MGVALLEHLKESLMSTLDPQIAESLLTRVKVILFLFIFVFYYFGTN